MNQSTYYPELTQSDTMNMTENQTANIPEVGGLEQFTKGLYVFGIPVMCVFGILGNVLSFKIFFCSSFWKLSSARYIVAINVSDTGFLTLLLLSYLGNGRLGIKYGHSPIWCHAMIYLTYVCSFLSVWYVVLIMIDRYIVVCHSLHVPRWCSKKRSRIAIGIVTTFGLLLYAHTFFTADIQGDSCNIQYKPFMLNILRALIYTDTAITVIIPFALIFLLNVVVILSIHNFKRHQRRLEQKTVTLHSSSRILSKAQFRITRTFILVSIMLLITNVPSHGIRFYIMAKELVQYNSSTLVQTQHICQMLYYLNYAINFLLYSLTNKTFRKHLTLKYLFCFCQRKRHLDSYCR